MTENLKGHLVDGFRGAPSRTGSLLVVAEDIHYIKDKGQMPSGWEHYTPGQLFQLHIDVMKFKLEEGRGYVDQLEAMAEKFGSFRAPSLNHHPFHRYEIVLFDIAEKLRDTIEHLCLTI